MARSFQQGLFLLAQPDIDQGEHAKGRPIVGLLRHDLLLSGPGTAEGGPGARFIVRHAGDEALAEVAIEGNRITAKKIIAKRDESSFRGRDRSGVRACILEFPHVEAARRRHEYSRSDPGSGSRALIPAPAGAETHNSDCRNCSFHDNDPQP
jgi:hypothetical protein